MLRMPKVPSCWTWYARPERFSIEDQHHRVGSTQQSRQSVHYGTRTSPPAPSACPSNQLEVSVVENIRVGTQRCKFDPGPLSYGRSVSYVQHDEDSNFTLFASWIESSPNRSSSVVILNLHDSCWQLARYRPWSA